MTANADRLILSTPHGELRTPAFLPDATRGVVRSVDSADLAAAGVQGVCVNAFHLMSNPGAGAVGALGGVHRMMGWPGPILSDSGGFQVYSLLRGAPKSGSVTGKGFRYRLQPGGDAKLLTPAKCIRSQCKLGADVLVCLDHCTHPDDPPARQADSVKHTVAWARACKAELDRATAEADARPMLLAVVQGGTDPALRRRCAEQLLEIGFDGYGFGGWPIDADGRLQEAVAMVAELTPDDAPRWALGIGRPEHVVAAAAMGYDLFDCVLPTRDARRGRLYAFTSAAGVGEGFYDRLFIHDKRHVRDPASVDETCDCPCCATYSRAYLHHLFHVGDTLAGRLATIHNLRFYARLMARLRGEE